MKGTLKTALYALVSLAMFSMPALAADCTIGGAGMTGSLSKMTGICSQLFATDKILWYVMLPAIAFAFIIWGVLEEIGLFTRKPSVHVALSILLSAMLLPSGVFGKVALSLYAGGAMFMILGVGAVMFLGVNAWVQRKTHEYAYAGFWRGWRGMLLAGLMYGFTGYSMAEFYGGQDSAMWAFWGVAFGIFWTFFGNTYGQMQASTAVGSAEARIRRLENEIGQLSLQLDLKRKTAPRTDTERAIINRDISSLMDLIHEKENQIRMIRDQEESTLNKI
ncbi:MAG: hypothetical protein V1731_00085 [Candidatus Aenigmatarchaeota archaeon]